MPGLGEIITESQIWKSVFRHPMPVDRRNRIVVMLTNFFLHLHPVSIKKQGIALSYTWCMGGVTFFLFLVETVTGVLLMFYYRPTLEWAYNDILALRDVYSLGIMREIHRWGAHAMVITVWLHMYRVFLTGSYKPPREFNWVIGVLLLVTTFLLSFTGYLLPWDQLALWAITVGTEIGGAAPLVGDQVNLVLRGDYEIGQSALVRFYTLHVIFLPLVAAFLMAVHFWRIRKDGGISGPL
jgi:quinol-cytochrome oxidoreductase complex cytochrome b subunit